MSSINTYADQVLLDFTDAVHAELFRILHAHYGPDWLTQGVRKHFAKQQFLRVEQMLQNPMRVIDMGKQPDELHGLEHFWNIVNGNWSLFKNSLGDKARTEVFLGEISELRHNLAHRRNRHILLNAHFIRIVDNCCLLLAALHSPHYDKFCETRDSLASGGAPWGPPLDGRLPPSDEIYTDFVGRPKELLALSDWLATDNPQILVWGYGGAGKSALAYKFARDIRESSNENLLATAWVSAKIQEYIEGVVKMRAADFNDLDSLLGAIWSALYGDDAPARNLAADDIIQELAEFPILLVVDDFDTVSEDESLSEFLLHDLRNTPTRVIYTSRRRVPGIKNLEVPSFSNTELHDFILLRSPAYGADAEQCVKRLDAIRRVTGGYPLFVDDLLHHAALVGVDVSLRDWSQKKGDAAREYALRRQIDHLGRSCGDVLIALAAANRALTPVEISNISGLTDDDSEDNLRELLRWRMVNRVTEEAAPAYRMNGNTQRLVRRTFKDDNRVKTYSVAFASLTGERVPEAKRKAIGRIVYKTNEKEFREGFSEALDYLQSKMVGELGDSPDLFGLLGRLYSRQADEGCWQKARTAFERSHKLWVGKMEPYFHWVIMEKNIADMMVSRARDGNMSNEEVAEQWRRCERIAEMGIDRCGPSQLLCYWAGYTASRSAKSQEHAQSFAYAQGAYGRSADWFRQALEAPVTDVAPVNRGAIYRGLTVAMAALGEEERLRRTLLEWHALVGTDQYFLFESRRALQGFPALLSDVELRRALAAGGEGPG